MITDTVAATAIIYLFIYLKLFCYTLQVYTGGGLIATRAISYSQPHTAGRESSIVADCH